MQTTAHAKAPDWRTIANVEQTVQAYPGRMQSLVESLNLEYPGLEAVREAWGRKDLAAACEALLGYYKNGATMPWMRKGQPIDERVQKIAEDAIHDRFEQVAILAVVPRHADGKLDWIYPGPKNDMQFPVAMNRHSFFIPLVSMWHATGEAKYAETVDRLVRDWVLQFGKAPAREEPQAVWTALNPGIRMSGSWPQAFYGLQQAEAFTPAARLLLLSTVPEHAAFLQKHLRPKHNFATMQMNGLGNIGLVFPEFSQAEAWYGFALKQVLEELQTQVYPDGAQKELTSLYHWVALKSFESLAGQIVLAGRVLPPEFKKSMEQMYAYLAFSLRPDGGNPLNNDSDRFDVRGHLLKASETYNRPDWRYIATNGREGTAPDGSASRMFPWAGQLVSRSGWDVAAQWSFFDVGPFGVSHQHNDMLHLSIHAYERDLLVDSGRFAYQGEIADKFRDKYGFHSRGHNVILVDGLGQQAGDFEAKTPHVLNSIQEEYDFAFGEFRNGFHAKPKNSASLWNKGKLSLDGTELPVRHARATIYLRGRGWLVFDRVAGQGDHAISPLWHFHPSCNVILDGRAVLTQDEGKGNLRITPVGKMDWQVTLVKGQEEPTLQGWYSRSYGQVEPSACAVYEGRFRDEAIFGWVMVPAKGIPAPVQAEWLEAPAGTARLSVTWPGEQPRMVTVVMDEAVLPVVLPDGRRLTTRVHIESQSDKARRE